MIKSVYLSAFFPISVTDDNKGFSSIKESSTTNNNQLTTTADTNKTTGGDKKPLKLGNKIRKPIDLGAAATFAARAQPSTQQLSTNEPQSNNVSNKTTTNFDLFATDQDSGDFNSQQQQPSSLVITGDDEFDPRGLGRYAKEYYIINYHNTNSLIFIYVQNVM